MKEYSVENIVLAVCIAIFGAIVHLANRFTAMKRKAVTLGWLDAWALFVTSLFSGLVFGLLSILMGETLNIQITAVQLWLSIAIGAVLGWEGLVKVANRSADIVLFTLKR